MPNESHLPAGQPAHGASGVGPGYEVRDTNVRGVVIFLVGLTAFVIVVQVVLWGVLRALEATAPEPPLTGPVPAAIHEQVEALRKGEDAALAGSAPSARMPIEAAFKEIEEKGIPLSATGLTEADVNAHAGVPAAKADASAKK